MIFNAIYSTVAAFSEVTAAGFLLERLKDLYQRSRNAAGLAFPEVVEWDVDAPNWDCNEEEEDAVAVADEPYVEEAEEVDEDDEDTDEDNGDADTDEECDVEG
ncbi:hypothetical protein BGX26_003008 [Mortierella sp. AD094]|nr:hypothetical protein BGX26_003008 [Mortierella sp. AD094]